MLQKKTKGEHTVTRELWEEVFAEDSTAFLDYYYSEVTPHSDIYTVEAGAKIRAMLHLNPYEVKAGPFEGRLHYIVGVATRKKYRGQGYMAALLQTALQEAYGRGEPFIYLMPAAEAIYYPYDFRFIYRQDRSSLQGEWEEIGGNYVYETAREEDCKEAAAFAGKCLEKMTVYAKRSEAYYKRLRKEQQSENGGLLCIRDRETNVLKGILYYAQEGTYREIREPLFAEDILEAEQKKMLSRAAGLLFGRDCQKVVCQGFKGEGKHPVIMARMLDAQAFFACFTAAEEIEGTLFLEDPLLQENTGLWRLSAGKGEPVRAVKLEETAVSETVLRAASVDKEKAVLTPGFLMSVLSGDLTPEAAGGQEKLVPDEETRELLLGIRPWERVFLNEIV